MRALIAIVLLVGACAPVARPAPPQEPTSATASPATPRVIPGTNATPEPTPTAPTGPQLDAPVVKMAETQFAIVPALALTRSAPAADDEEAARFAIHWYLHGLDRYRDHGDYLPVSGNFGTAVAAALSESRTPGVRRTFVLESLRIEGVYRKPWGTRALVDVHATIVDRAVGRSAPDQRETGLLRLSGERRLQVVDAWDAASGRWFNGRGPDDTAALRPALEQPIASYLHSESWQSGMPMVTYFSGAGTTPFMSARAAYLATLDRTAIASRIFEDATGTIERFDTFAEMAGGMAIVRVAATVVTTDAAGRSERQPTVRRVKVFFGNWVPEVVDEEVSPGVWRSGGDLALIDIDVSRA